jgi:hypothetical protein
MEAARAGRHRTCSIVEHIQAEVTESEALQAWVRSDKSRAEDRINQATNLGRRDSGRAGTGSLDTRPTPDKIGD